MQPVDVQGPYQQFPPLSSQEYAALRDDVAERGILVPVEVDEHGAVLDGHHRVAIAAELGLTQYPRVVRVGLSEPEKLRHAAALNLHRRHLTRAERALRARELSAEGWSARRIAEALGTSEPTVRRDLTGASGEQTAERWVQGRDGKRYRATRSIFVRSAGEQRRAAAALTELGDEAPAIVDLRRAERLVRERRRHQLVGEQPPAATPLIRCMDMRDLDLPPVSIDLIFTDPPYRSVDMQAWSDLGRLAERVLKPGAVLVAYAGQMFLPEILRRLEQSNLEYHWTFAALHQHQVSQVRQRNIGCGWKQLLVYRQPGGPAPAWTVDVSTAGRREKNAHPWQQAVNEAAQWIAALCRSDGVVLDPFMGSGTTAVAAHRVGRAVIGCERDAAVHAAAVARVAHAVESQRMDLP